MQLWVALPDAHRDAPRGVRSTTCRTRSTSGARRCGCSSASSRASSSPVPTFTPLLGAELVLAAGADVTLDVDPGFEHGVLVDRGTVSLAGTPLAPRRPRATVAAGRGAPGPGATGDEPARVMLLGGPPFGEDIVMWWNFVGRSHDEIVAFRAAWEAGSERFGSVEGYVGRDGRRDDDARLPAPALPHATIRPRGNPRR